MTPASPASRANGRGSPRRAARVAISASARFEHALGAGDVAVDAEDERAGRRASITNRSSRMVAVDQRFLAALVERVDRGERAVARPFDIGVAAVVG